MTTVISLGIVYCKLVIEKSLKFVENFCDLQVMVIHWEKNSSSIKKYY